MLYTIIATIVVIFILSKVISTRNNFEKLRRAVQAEASNISIYLAKRADCLNDLLNIAKINYRQEVSGIEKLTEKDQLNQLAYLGQKYPELQSSGAYNEQMRQAGILQEDIAASRALLNGNIQTYNDAITSFPGLIVAVIFGYKKEKFINEESSQENKNIEIKEVDFSKYC